MSDTTVDVDVLRGQVREKYRAVAVAPGNSATCALFDDGMIKCWGDPYQGALGPSASCTHNPRAGTLAGPARRVERALRQPPGRATGIARKPGWVNDFGPRL